MDVPDVSKFGPYVVSGQVGEGSLGVVYRARHEELGREAAVKVLRPEVRGNAAAVAGMVSEASTLARLDHPNIVMLYDFVQEPERTWLAEQWVDGAPLDVIVEAHGRLAPEQALGVVAGALAGLAYAHDHGVVHRDVSASNVLADLAGTSMLVDFGLASPVAAASPGPSTGSVGVVGTPAYLSPEAARGDAVGKAGDVYSAAALTYHLLSGSTLFRGTPWEMVAAHRDQEAPQLQEHGPRLAGLLERSLAKDPAARPADAAAFLAELEESAAEQYGAAWRTRASIAGLVASTVGVAAATGLGSAAGGAAPTGVASGLSPGVTGVGQAVVSTGRRAWFKPLIVGGALAAVVATGAIALASGGDDGKDNAGGTTSGPTVSEEDLAEQERERERQENREKIAELEATVPAGVYRFVARGSFNLRDGSTRPLKDRGTWDLAGASCSASGCRGTVESSNGAIWRYAWDGSTMSIDRPVRRDGWGQCSDVETGETIPLAEAAARSTATFEVGAVSVTQGATGEPPQTISFSYEGVLTQLRFRGRCEAGPKDALSWTADVTLTRKG